MKFLVHFVFLLGCVSLVSALVVLATAVWFALTADKPEQPGPAEQTTRLTPRLTLTEATPADIVSLTDVRARRRRNGAA